MRPGSPISALSADTGMDMRADDAADGQWLTHAEIAAMRGISTASAIKLALRHHWRKQKDNRGTLRCLVPADFIGPQPGVRADTRTVARADAGADLSAVSQAYQDAREAFQQALQAKAEQVAALQGQLAHERTRADITTAERDDLRTKLTDAQTELAAAQDQAEEVNARAVAAEIAQAEAEADAAELRDQLEQTRAQAEAALQEAAALKAAAEAAGRGGRWARIRRAWWRG
jgi:hypothetical protein